MLKKINQVLKLVGFNLVHAKKPKARKSYAATYPGRSYVAGSHTCKSGDASATTCIGATPGDGRTHYEGDSCPGGHTSGYVTNGECNTVIGHEAKLFVTNPNAAFVPVVLDRPAVEQPNSNNNITGPTS